MKILPSARYGSVSVTREMPPHYEPYRLPASDPLYTKGRFGDCLTQVITGNGFSIRFCVLTILLAGAAVHACTTTSLTTLCFMLQQDIHLLLKGFGEIWLREGMYNLLQLPGGVLHDAWLHRGLHLSFHISLTPSFLRRQQAGNTGMPYTPEGAPGMPYAARMTPRIKYVIGEEIMKHCPAEGSEQNDFLETRIGDLLQAYDDNKAPAAPGPPLPEERALAGRLKTHIENNLEGDLSLSLLADRLSAGKTGLEQVCRRVFHQSVHRYIVEKRLEKSCGLLLHTDMPVKAIALAAGFHSLPSFTALFHQEYRMPPAAFRRNWRSFG